MIVILIAILGCNIYYILQDRLVTAEELIKNISKTNKDVQIDWFLSGGKKSQNSFLDESEIIYKYIEKLENIYNFEFNYILDNESTNTAQNLYALSYYLNNTNKIYDNINIITSDYHFERANAILNMIDNSRKFNWFLGLEEEISSRYWENIHMKNIEQDVFSII
jgi:hypothetical protein